MADLSIDTLVEELRQVARADPATNWHAVVSEDAVAFAEDSLDVKFPEILKRCYTQISNGGFGPGYQLTGLPGGHESSWGDLLQTTIELRLHEDCEDEWLPLIDWGCAQFTVVDCSDQQIVTLYEGDFHNESYTLTTFLKKWVNGELPRLDTGSFYPIK
jgi:SMI1/KNR4 family protein SUKH-1